MLGSNNYLGLTGHCKFEAASRALHRHGSAAPAAGFRAPSTRGQPSALAEFLGRKTASLSTGTRPTSAYFGLGRGEVVYLDKLDHPRSSMGPRCPTAILCASLMEIFALER
jgi:hypothetical protein